ncbi:hypothetical protein A6F68_01937 [Tsuneonella dongtanensis]|uniref:DUF2459 domain-containing protein n=1 Tax=Tsuneonella dongtanensis TaxID=692370 RepID=A0A1B2AEH1_9SPHN|nr:TIGR02117 family protein [Tsuneonella dongtanensis]ANY20445.1 hypothetical protein A6F68_01937 [Tsuneonella dongtanensis]
MRVALRALAWLALAIGLVPLTGWIGSSIPRNSAWTEPAAGVEIMVETNGVHTAIVMPLVTSQKDWRSDFPASDLGAPNRPYTHVSVSWGEREVFLNTPTWAELSPMTALRAATGGDGLLHVAHYVRPAPSPDARVLRLREEEYARLVAVIEAQVASPDQRKVYPGYEDWDVFYDAPGRYHAGRTCNQWTSNTLAAAGVRTGWWTPFAGGVMKWVAHPRGTSKA